jgi:hypothetical protein
LANLPCEKKTLSSNSGQGHKGLQAKAAATGHGHNATPLSSGQPGTQILCKVLVDEQDIFIIK